MSEDRSNSPKLSVIWKKREMRISVSCYEEAPLSLVTLAFNRELSDRHPEPRTI